MAPTPTELSAVSLAGKKVKSFTIRASHACAVLDDGILNCWGNGEYGQLGLGSFDSTTGSPANLPRVALGGRALKVATGPSHTCAILDNGTVKCGAPINGELGIGDTQYAIESRQRHRSGLLSTIRDGGITDAFTPSHFSTNNVAKYFFVDRLNASVAIAS